MASYKLATMPSESELVKATFQGQPITLNIEGLGERKALVTSIATTPPDQHVIEGNFFDGKETRFKAHLYMVDEHGLVEMADQAATTAIPQNGNQAYSVYHGRRYEGTLNNLRTHGRPQENRLRGELIPPHGSWGFHGSFTGLYIGYDEAITWDEAEGMWYAPADWD